MNLWDRFNRYLFGEPWLGPESEPESEPEPACWETIISGPMPLPLERRRAGDKWIVRYFILKDGWCKKNARMTFSEAPTLDQILVETRKVVKELKDG